MLSAQSIGNQNVSRVPNMLGNTELPETGAFDFFNYLLGLQVSSADLIQGQEAPLTGPGIEAESIDSKDPLQTLFQKKEQPLWNPMIPVGGAIPLTSPLAFKPNADQMNQKLPVLSENSSNGKPIQSNQLLENRLLEPKLFLETKEKGVDVNSAEEFTDSDKAGDGNRLNDPVADLQKSKGIEKYTDASQLNVQQAKQTERSDSLQTVSNTETNSRMTPEVSSHITKEAKSSERKRGEDQDSSTVVLNAMVQSQKALDGQHVTRQESQGVGEKATLPEVFKKVESMIHHGGGKMTVQLSPPELGKLEVDVVTKGNQVEIKMRSDNDIAKITLESHMGDLKNAMEGQNLSLNKVEVQVGLDQGHSYQQRQFAAFSGNEQGGFNRQSSQHSNRSANLPYKPELGLSSISKVSSLAGAKSVGGVDLRI